MVFTEQRGWQQDFNAEFHEDCGLLFNQKPTYIFKRLSEACQALEALLNNIRGPLINFVLLVRIVSDGKFNRLTSDRTFKRNKQVTN